MINRIVRMSFKPESVVNFLEVFEASKHHIAGFEGCEGLTLLRDEHKPNVFFTYSYWRSEEFLNNYRHSALFEATWAKTKILFNDKPQAWSTVIFDKVK